MQKSIMTLAALTTAALLAAVVSVPAPGYAQSRELIQLQGDVVRLQHLISEMQSGLDARNAAFQGLVEQVVDQLAVLAGSVEGINAALGEVQQSNSVLSGEMRVLMGNLRDDVEILDRNLGDVRNQITTLSQQVTNLPSVSTGGDSAQDLMSIAEADLFAGNLALAIEGFRDYLRSYPNGTDAALAQLYVGNAYSEQGAYEQAIIEYDLLLQKYPNSDRKVTALFRKGLALAEMGQTSSAVNILREVVADYPDSREAVRAQERITELQ